VYDNRTIHWGSSLLYKYQLGGPHPSPKDTSAGKLTERAAILAKALLLLSLLCRVFAAKRPALAKITRDFTPGNMLSPHGLHINNTKQVLHKQCSNNKYQRN